MLLESMGITTFLPSFMSTVGHRAVYERMLSNLLGAYQRLRQTGTQQEAQEFRGDFVDMLYTFADKLLGVAKQLLVLRGENSVEDLLTCGRLHMLLTNSKRHGLSSRGCVVM